MNTSILSGSLRKLGTALLLAGSLAGTTHAAQAAQAVDTPPAPDFKGINHWINSQPLSMVSLHGKVVLVDFWTSTCINCIHTLPHVAQWYDKYKNDGLVVVGVHTPEFPEEKATATVEQAAQRFGLHYPIAQDNGYATWNAYNNQYWPAVYLIDRSGKIVAHHYGEGSYDEMEAAIKKLLAEPARG